MSKELVSVKELKKSIGDAEEVKLHFTSGKKKKVIKFKDPKEGKAMKALQLFTMQRIIGQKLAKFKIADIKTEEYILKAIEVDGHKLSAKTVMAIFMEDSKFMKSLK